MKNIDTIYLGNAKDILSTLPDSSIHCCITSPPYFNLRDYGCPGQIGLENTTEEYIDNLVQVFIHVRRLLTPDGTLWINIGDTYAGSGKGAAKYPSDKYKQSTNKGSVASPAIVKKFPNYKQKDLMGIPWQLAFALREQGWYLRQDIIWAKPNPMPESVHDRCTKSHEYIFMLSKSPRYYFDAAAIQEETVTTQSKTYKARYGGKKYTQNPKQFNRTKSGNIYQHREYRNKRDVWIIPTQPITEAHFATYPQQIVANCMKAGCPPHGIVLDPFMGSGTTAIVAKKLDRHYIGVELNPQYKQIAEKRLQQIGHTLFEEITI